MKNAQALLTSRIVLMGTMPYLVVPQLRDGKSVGSCVLRAKMPVKIGCLQAWGRIELNPYHIPSCLKVITTNTAGMIGITRTLDLSSPFYDSILLSIISGSIGIPIETDLQFQRAFSASFDRLPLLSYTIQRGPLCIRDPYRLKSFC